MVNYFKGDIDQKEAALHFKLGKEFGKKYFSKCGAVEAIYYNKMHTVYSVELDKIIYHGHSTVMACEFTHNFKRESWEVN